MDVLQARSRGADDDHAEAVLARLWRVFVRIDTPASLQLGEWLESIGLQQVGGWKGLVARLPEQYTHTWRGMGSEGDPLGVPWWVMVVGIGLTAAPAYWCTDFLLVQRALAAKNLDAARKTPLVAAIPKMFFPAIVTVLGMLALVVGPEIVTKDYNLALPMLLGKYYGSGMLG